VTQPPRAFILVLGRIKTLRIGSQFERFNELQ
jgi:hypothetical protein